MNYPPSTQVERVDGCQLKVRNVHVQFADNVAQKEFLVSFGELQDSRQDGLLSLGVARTAAPSGQNARAGHFGRPISKRVNRLVKSQYNRKTD